MKNRPAGLRKRDQDNDFVRNTFILFLLLAALPVPAATIVVLNSYTNAEAPSSTVAPLSSGSVSEEFLLAGSQFSTLTPGSSLTALGFRLDGGSGTLPPVDYSYSTFQLQLSTSLVPLGSLSTTFSNNIGPDVVTVRSGSLTIPANAMTGGAGANPFYFIPFTTPYVYQGGDLLVTIVSISNQAGTVSIDAVGVGGLVDSATSGGVSQYFNVPVFAFQADAPAGGASVPEPGTFALLAVGCGVLLIAGRTRNR